MRSGKKERILPKPSRLAVSPGFASYRESKALGKGSIHFSYKYYHFMSSADNETCYRRIPSGLNSLPKEMAVGKEDPWKETTGRKTEGITHTLSML